MNALIVEDDYYFRKFLRKCLKDMGILADIAKNGNEAIDILSIKKMDIIITDWLMPGMDGITLVEKIRKEISPPPLIIVITGINLPDARIKVLDSGADEFIPKPVEKNTLISIISTALKVKAGALSPRKLVPEAPSHKPPPPFVGFGIAASTGGPMTLWKVMEKFKKTENAAIFIVQHGPEWMLKSFTERMRKYTDMKVYLGETGQPVEKGVMYVCPGNIHMGIDQETLSIKLIDTPPENYVKPSADPLFRSISFVFRNRSIGMVITGMGHDGTIGAGYIKAAGGKVIVQDPEEATLPSMPKSVINLGLADVKKSSDQLAGTMHFEINTIFNSIRQ